METLLYFLSASPEVESPVSESPPLLSTVLGLFSTHLLKKKKKEKESIAFMKE